MEGKYGGVVRRRVTRANGPEHREAVKYGHKRARTGPYRPCT